MPPARRTRRRLLRSTSTGLAPQRGLKEGANAARRSEIKKKWKSRHFASSFVPSLQAVGELEGHPSCARSRDAVRLDSATSRPRFFAGPRAGGLDDAGHRAARRRRVREGARPGMVALGRHLAVGTVQPRPPREETVVWGRRVSGGVARPTERPRCRGWQVHSLEQLFPPYKNTLGQSNALRLLPDASLSARPTEIKSRSSNIYIYYNFSAPTLGDMICGMNMCLETCEQTIKQILLEI